MFKWPGTPSPRASRHELADYAELDCWKRNSTSINTLSADLGRLEENDYSDGVPEEEEASRVVEEAYLEIEQRKKACGVGYPFVIDKHGYTLRTSQEAGNHKHVIYKYLLLATRLNMKDNRNHADIDGALLFEEVASEAARGYLGARAESLVFGTAAGMDDFPGKVNDLCKRMKEGVRFCKKSAASPDERDGKLNERDGKLNVVAWKDFTDGSPGKLITFGQCKTGTNYKDTLTQLQPDSFCDKWLLRNPAVSPVRMFLISEALSRIGWYDVTRDAGLLFDRCRIVDFCDGISEDVLNKVATWTEAAAKANELPGL